MKKPLIKIYLINEKSYFEYYHLNNFKKYTYTNYSDSIINFVVLNNINQYILHIISKNKINNYTHFNNVLLNKLFCGFDLIKINHE